MASLSCRLPCSLQTNIVFNTERVALELALLLLTLCLSPSSLSLCMCLWLLRSMFAHEIFIADLKIIRYGYWGHPLAQFMREQ